MKHKSISVITTFYNAQDTLEDTISSILKQDYENLQMIFVDGKSTDRSLEIVNQYANQFKDLKVISEPDNGIYDGMNKGICAANGDIVAILNADDYFEPGALTAINELFESDADVVAATTQKVYNDGRLFEKVLRSEMPPLSPMSSAISHPSVFVKRGIYDTVGMFNTKYKISADYDFISRATNAGAKIVYSDIVTTNMRIGGVSDSIKFHTKKNIEHILIGLSHISSFSNRIKHIGYVAKKYIYGLLKYIGILK
ncbi:glycosyltransferase family 2 protein [Thalassotalea maritima]|uniref:glycosyltransferase family 2 protein n=1 Tax=Thalassotalea maritima TaxID=3242416 RepID=UPI003526E090